MLKINKDCYIEEALEEKEIREYLKSLVVNETLSPIKQFIVTGENKNDTSKKYEIVFTATSYDRMENGILVRDYYSENLVEKFMNITKEFGKIFKIK